MAAREHPAAEGVRLCSAAGSGDLAQVDALLQSGVSPDGRDQRGSPALYYAASNCHFEAAARLLSAGADINARDIDGRTTLAKISEPDMIRWLEARGATK